jgi:sulfide:quinone oxidoreductase
MSSKTILILGGGLGGLVTANELRRFLPREHRIVVIDRRAKHLFTPALLRVMLGHSSQEKIQADLNQLQDVGIEFVQAEIQAIEPSTRRVQTSSGEFEGDFLVIALGAQAAPELTPGFAEAAFSPYSLEGAIQIRDALQSFSGGKIVVAVTGLPYICGAAPYKTAAKIHEYLKKRGLREKTELQLISPEAMPMGVGGPVLSNKLKQVLVERNIPYRPKTRTRCIDPGTRELVLKSDERVPFDLLVAVPPHRSPQVVHDAGLTNESGWIPVDAHTLATRFDDVFALGDITTIPLPGRFNPDRPLGIPKSGAIAQKGASIVVHNLVNKITGQGKPREFDGFSGCAIDLGNGRAIFFQGNFYDPKAPALSVGSPSRFWNVAKILTEKYWMWRWFGNKPPVLRAVGDLIMFS